MGRIWGNLTVGFAVGALIASLPAHADTETITVAPGQTQVQTNQITDTTVPIALSVTGGGTLVLSNAANSYTAGNVFAGGSTVRVTVDGDLGATSSGITLGDATSSGTLDLSTGTAAVTTGRQFVIAAGSGTIVAGTNPWTLSGVVSGTGPLTLTGGGTVVLAGANTYTGTMTIDGGTTLSAALPTNLGGGILTLGDATTRGTLNLSSAAAAETAANAIIVNTGGGTIVTGANAWTLSGVISGAGHLTIDGGGTLTPTAVNTYTGGTTISGGSTVVISTDSDLGATTGGLTLGDATTGGTLQLASASAVTSARSLTLGAGGGVIDVSAAAWTIVDPISGAGGLTLTGTGTLILDGANTYAGATAVNAGTLQIGDVGATGASIAGNVTVASGAEVTGFGAIMGNLSNNGTVAPGKAGSAGTLTVASYYQSTSGTLSIVLTPTAASELKVTGTATIAGTLALVANGQLHASTYQLLSAGTLNGTFTTVSDTLSAAFSQQIIYSPTGVDLVLTQLNTLPENPTIFSDIASTAVDGAQNANTTLMSHLTGIRTGAEVDGMNMATSSTHRAGNSVGSSPYGAWAQAEGGFGSTGGSGGAPGFDVHGGGFMAGIDAQVGKGGVLGAAIGYDVSALSESGGASGTINTPRFAVYGGYWWGPVAIDGSIGVGVPSVTSDRPVSQTGTTATTSYVGTELSAAIQASSTMSVGRFAVTPAIGAEFARLGLHSFSETGAGGYNLDGQSSTTNSLRPFVAATASSRYFVDARTVLEPTLRIAYSTEALGNSRQVAIQPSGDDATFLVEGAKPSRGEGSINAGLVVETNHDLGFFTDAALVGLGNTSGIQLDAGVRYRF